MKYHIRLDEPASGHRKVKIDCPYCRGRKTFSRYYDFDKGEYIGDSYGRCDRENRCGAHVPPPKQKQDYTVPVRTRIDASIVQRTLQGYARNQLLQYLCTLFDKDEVYATAAKYEVGTAKMWGGASVFWQRDIKKQYRSGKIMGYDKAGHRVKGQTTWAHTAMRLKSFEIEQCLFGEHLLAEDKETPVAVFESEKTALIYDLFEPGLYLCLACGAKDGMGGKSLNRTKVAPLLGRDVVLFPDSSPDRKTFAQWVDLAKQMQEHGINAQVLDWEEVLLPEHQNKGLDVADLITAQPFIPTELIQHVDPDKEFYLPF